MVSVGPDGQAAGISGYTSPMSPVISADGRYVAFESGLSYLDQPILPGVTGDQLYVRDLTTNMTSLVSASASGAGVGDFVSSVATVGLGPVAISGGGTEPPAPIFPDTRGAAARASPIAPAAPASPPTISEAASRDSSIFGSVSLRYAKTSQ